MGCVCFALLLDAMVDPMYISAVYQGHSGYEMRVEIAAKLLESAVVWLLVVKAPWVRLSLPRFSFNGQRTPVIWAPNCTQNR